jgi:predicted Zn-dependent protease
MMKLPRYLMLGVFVASAFLSAAHAADENWRERLSAQDEVTAGDVSAEVVFGRKIAAKILGRYKTYDNPALLKYINLVGLVLARNSGRPELNFHFMVLDTDEINAYAAPGGYVFVTRGALQLMKDESELAGVLAHEIGHVAEMHVVKELKIKGENESVTAGLAQLVGGSSESARAAFAQAVDRGLEMIFKEEYKREDEMQSDKDAVILCALSGYEPTALAKYLDKARSIKGEVSDAGQTHPSYSTRISRINDVIVQNGIETDKSVVNAKRFDVAMNGIKASR